MPRLADSTVAAAVPFQPTITETSRCLAAELSPIAERQAEEQSRRFARLQALRDDVARARQLDETFSPSTNKPRTRRGHRGQASPASQPSTVFASTPPSASPSSAVRTSTTAAAEDLDEEEVRGLWEAFAVPYRNASGEQSKGLTADGACRLLTALGLLTREEEAEASHLAQTRLAVRDKFLRALGLSAPGAIRDVVSFDRFYFVFARVWRAGSCTPSRSMSRPREASSTSLSPRRRIGSTTTDRPSSQPSAAAANGTRERRVHFQLPHEAAVHDRAASAPSQVVVCELDSSSSSDQSESEVPPRPNRNEDLDDTPSPAPRNPCERSASPAKPLTDSSCDADTDVATSHDGLSPHEPQEPGLSESPDAVVGRDDSAHVQLDVDEATPKVLSPPSAQHRGPCLVVGLRGTPARARSRSPMRRQLPAAIAADAHVLTPTVSTVRKQQDKRAAYDPMAQCTFAPVTTPYTPPPRPVAEAATSPIARSPVLTPPSTAGKNAGQTPTPSKRRKPMARMPAPAGFDKAVQRMQQARAEPSVAAPPRPSMFARTAAPPPAPTPVVDLYADRNELVEVAAEDDEVRMYVDVDLPKGGTVRIPVYDDDTPAALAAEFAATYHLDATHKHRLEVLLASLPPM